MYESQLYELLIEKDPDGSRILCQFVHDDSSTVSTKIKSCLKMLLIDANNKNRAVKSDQLEGLVYRYPDETGDGDPVLLMRFNVTATFIDLMPLEAWEAETYMKES